MRFAHPLFLFQRFVRALVLVVVAGSAALVLVHLAPGDAFSELGIDPARAAEGRARLGLDRPFTAQYVEWLTRAAALDFGESVRFGRPVASLVGERVGPTVLLGLAALVLAIGAGLPAGVLTGSSPRAPLSRAIRAVSLLLISVPPLVTSLLLLLLAARTGIVGAGGFGREAGGLGLLLQLPLPALALALPIAASLERLQSDAMREALREPSIAAARARGLSVARTTWLHAWRLSLTPVLGVLGIVIGSVLSGSLVVELVMSWPGLGDLMYAALVSRDVQLAAGCAVAAAAFLAAGLELAEMASRVIDPRREAV